MFGSRREAREAKAQEFDQQAQSARREFEKAVEVGRDDETCTRLLKEAAFANEAARLTRERGKPSVTLWVF